MSTRLGRVLVESAKQIAQHMGGEIELPMKVVRVVPDVDVRAIRDGQGLTREQFVLFRDAAPEKSRSSG